MIDFLTDLIDRAQSRAPVLERRQRALFESAPIADSESLPVIAAAMSERAELSAGDATQSHAPSGNAPNGPRVEPPVSHKGAVPAGRDAEQETRRTRPRKPAKEVETPVPVPRRTAATELIPADRPRPVATRAGEVSRERPPVNRNPGSAEAKSVASVRADRGEPMSAKEEKRNSTSARTEPRVVTARDHNPTAKNQSPSPLVLHSRPRAHDTTRVPATVVMRARARSEARTLLPAMPLPAPIHISIGRVEVRATSVPQPAVRTSTRAAPRLPLDEYLTGRTRGTQ